MYASARRAGAAAAERAAEAAHDDDMIAAAAATAAVAAAAAETRRARRRMHRALKRERVHHIVAKATSQPRAAWRKIRAGMAGTARNDVFSPSAAAAADTVPATFPTADGSPEPAVTACARDAQVLYAARVGTPLAGPARYDPAAPAH